MVERTGATIRLMLAADSLIIDDKTVTSPAAPRLHVNSTILAILLNRTLARLGTEEVIMAVLPEHSLHRTSSKQSDHREDQTAVGEGALALRAVALESLELACLMHQLTYHPPPIFPAS